MPSNVLPFPGHTASSNLGYKSGRSSQRGTRDTRSSVSTRNGGHSSHCDIACLVTPTAAATLEGPPAALMARFNALLLLMAHESSTALHESQATLHCESQVVLYDSTMSLGKRIKAARARLRPKLTQPELGAVFGITKQSVSQWERDETVPDLNKLPKLAEKLRIPLSWLLDGTGKPPAPDSLESQIETLSIADRAMLLTFIETMRRSRDRVA